MPKNFNLNGYNDFTDTLLSGSTLIAEEWEKDANVEEMARLNLKVLRGLKQIVDRLITNQRGILLGFKMHREHKNDAL